ncbi:hypothetical protein [Anaerovibrio sp. RM50]|uniref:hypothetical protein n=1 Tax=Anaerovibrio sp. RM50 TaxID=1200557 RepID=UPI00055A1110|nr:hypothetical protein [Anaerovibrio sp. RM50]
MGEEILAYRMMLEADTLEEIMKYCKIVYPTKTPQEIKKFSEELLAIKNGEDICINQGCS